MGIYNQFELPNQRLPESQWTKKLYLDHANKMIEFIGNKNLGLKNETIAHLYRIYNCELSAKDNKLNESLTKQYGHDLGVKYFIYPLAEMLVDQLVGEYISLPLKKKMYSINKAAINSRLDEKVKYVSEDIFRAENKKLEGELGFKPETENPEIDLPDDIEFFFSKTYKTLEEELSDDIIVHFLDVLKEKRKYKTLLQDFLIGEQATVFIGSKDGHPSITRTKYDETYVDLNPEEEIQTDINVAAHFPYMTKNEILNKYPLEEKTLKKIDQIFEKMNQSQLLDDAFQFSKDGVDRSDFNNCKNGVSYKGWYESNSTHRLRVLKMQWKSRKEIRATVHVDKISGEEIFTLLNKNSKPRKRDNVKKVTIEVIREVEMLGPEILLKYGECKERMSYIDNNKKVNLPVVALRGRNTMFSTEVRSVVAKVEPLQNMASDILFELRLAIKANNGRVLVYDTAQIPKQFLDTYGKKGAINRMLHHIKKDKILLFNSKDKQSRNTFNQFTSLDLTNRGLIQDLMNALMLIESLGKKFVGITDERQGEVGQYQTKAGTDRSVIASNARTEVYFNPFDEFFQASINKVIQKAKSVYKTGQTFPLVFGDLMYKFLTVIDTFFNVDIGMYIGDRFKDQRDKQIIDQAAVQALGNASDRELILDLVNVLETEHASESKAILEKGLKAMEKLNSESQKALQASEEAKMAQEDKKMAHEKQIADDRNFNNKEVAIIYANNKTFSDGENNNSKELIAAAKIESDILKAEKADLNKEKQTQ
jgi:hypothetical protein